MSERKKLFFCTRVLLAANSRIKMISRNIYNNMLTTFHIPADSRITAFPIARHEIFALWEKAVSVHWVPKQLKFNEDAAHFAQLAPDRQRLIKQSLAFFASLDTLVNANILERFAQEFHIPEVDMFFAQQVHIEYVHSITYSMLINVYAPSDAERKELLDAVMTNPAVRRVADFVRKCISSEESLGCRLFRMACIEGVLFARVFAIIYFVTDGGELPGLRESNALIAKDENFHMIGGAVIHNTILPAEMQVTTAEASAVCHEVMEIADELSEDALPAPIHGMKAEHLREYTENQSNLVLEYFKLKPIYGATNPFEFMDKLNLETRTNFFEVQETNYSAVHDNNYAPEGMVGQAFVPLDDF